MIDVNRLKGEFVANGYTQGEIAEKLDMSPKTLSLKLKKGVLGSDEIETLIGVLDIKDPMSIFFTNTVT